LLYRVGLHKEAGLFQSAAAQSGDLFRIMVVGSLALVVVLAVSAISSERGTVADSVLSRGISRHQYFLAKWHARLVVVTATFATLACLVLLTSYFLFKDDTQSDDTRAQVAASLVGVRQVNPEAHELYLKARYYWNKRTEESVKKALSYFHRAIDNDPTYALGYAGLADSYNILGYYNALLPIEAYRNGKAAALKALELDNSLAAPHAALGVVKRDFEWDWSGAEEEFQRAIELNPGYVEAYHWRGTLFSMLGRHAEALREKNKALAIDPLSVVIRTDLARMFYFSRDYDQSLEQYRSALEMDPNFGSAHVWLSHVYEQKGLFQQAISELKTGMRLSSGSTFALAKLGHGYAMAGRCDEAHAVLNQLNALSSQRYVSPYDIAMVHVGLHENDEAFAWLQRAFEQRSLWLGYLKVEPQLDALRPDKRFHDLLRRVGLAQ
jgi:tetratricopeptide (TPR) repeat protein